MNYLISLAKDIVKKRRLIGELAKADFKKRFVGSYFGIVWMFIQPIVTVAIYYFVFGVGSPMSVVKPLLWLLEPYIVYKAYLWGTRFAAHPLTWEGEVDWFALMLTVLLILDAVALPLVIFYCPGLNPRVRVPDWIHRLGTPIYIVHNWLDGKVGGGTSTPIVWLRKTLHSLLLFIYYLVPFYVGGHLVMGLVVALMYDVLVWAHGGV